MFIIELIKREEASIELELLYKNIEKVLGFIPAHFELFATLDFKSLKEFVENNMYLMTHKKINKDILPYLRLFIAKKECRKYCINFNTKILLNMGADEKLINYITDNTNNIPFDDKQKAIFEKVLKALYKAEEFNQNDLKELYKLNFNNQDFFDLLNYTSSFMNKSKIIDIFLK